MGRKRQEKQRSEIRAHRWRVNLRDQQRNSRNVGMMEKEEYRRQESEDRRITSGILEEWNRKAGILEWWNFGTKERPEDRGQPASQGLRRGNPPFHPP
jgi:hypothetical protein